MAQTIWKNPQRFQESYLTAFPGYYHTGDGGFKDRDGYVYITGRTDDVINVSGHRLSTGEMEEVIAKNSAVAECAVIAVADEMKGHVPVGLVVLKQGVDTPDAEIEQQLVAMIRTEVGPLACFRKAIVVQRLPKTRSGKILRAILRKIADAETFAMPSTIDDETILPEIAQTMTGAGLGR